MDIKTTHTLTITDAEKDLLVRGLIRLHEHLTHQIEHIAGKEMYAKSEAAHRADVEALAQLHAQLLAA